jgi:acyl carrier protein
MTRDSLRQALAELVEQETGARPENLSDDTMLTDGLGMDSIDLIGLVVQVENRFKIKIATEELRKIAHVGELLNLLETKVAADGAQAASN